MGWLGDNIMCRTTSCVWTILMLLFLEIESSWSLKTLQADKYYMTLTCRFMDDFHVICMRNECFSFFWYKSYICTVNFDGLKWNTINMYDYLFICSCCNSFNFHDLPLEVVNSLSIIPRLHDRRVIPIVYILDWFLH